MQRIGNERRKAKKYAMRRKDPDKKTPKQKKILMPYLASPVEPATSR
jgi:hypothetical protein